MRLYTPYVVMAIVFLVLAVTFVVDFWGQIQPVRENAPIDARFLAHRTVRDPLDGDLRLKKAGFLYNCNDCHQHFVRPEGAGNLIAEHSEIQLSHGDNDRCLNCHNPENLESFVDHDGSMIEAGASEQLCRKCHGPKYRDWVVGVHGRPNGYWDETRGESKKATCVACHDPHSPQFEPIEPAPAPRERRGPAHVPESLDHEEHRDA